MTMTGSLQDRLAAFWSDSSGNAAMEFVILFPFLMFMLFSIAEAGVLMTRTVMLERGLDIAVRDLRIGATPGVTHDIIKGRICDAAFLLGACEEVVLLELAPLTDITQFPTGEARCVDRTSDVDPMISFDPGARSEIMIIRACLVVDPIFPGMGLGAMLPVDASGGYSIVMQSAFMNEPG